eukprot:1733055-Rhodomonas_salina.1
MAGRTVHVERLAREQATKANVLEAVNSATCLWTPLPAYAHTRQMCGADAAAYYAHIVLVCSYAPGLEW